MAVNATYQLRTKAQTLGFAQFRRNSDLGNIYPRKRYFRCKEIKNHFLVMNLRTVPTIVTAHTFGASQDTSISYGWCLSIQGYFCAVKNHFLVMNLRTVPTIITAHTFCASQDTSISYGWCLSIQVYFCAVQNYAEKAELCKCSWYAKRKLGVTMYFSEIIKLQFGKERHTLLCISKLFTNILD